MMVRKRNFAIFELLVPPPTQSLADLLHWLEFSGELRQYWTEFASNQTEMVPSQNLGRSSFLWIQWASRCSLMKKRALKSPKRSRVVFLFDVDNTLLDNDHVVADIRCHLQQEVGQPQAESYWKIFEQLRTELGYADYLGALQQYRREHPRELGVLNVSRFIINYPFANRLYPNSLDVIQHVGQWGAAVLLTDGDVVFQPRKVERSGLYEAVAGAALVYVHKELELDDVQARYPSAHYILVDDKLRILAAVKKVWRERVTTVFVRQGHYAQDANALASYPAADATVERIGDLLTCELRNFVPASRGGRTKH
jgi:FMN phosphatase YigB (HAD superfamily)